MKQKLEQMHLKKRLNFGYTTVIGLMILSGIVAFMAIALLFANTEHYISDVEKANIAVKNCRININIAARNIYEMALSNDKSSYERYQTEFADCLEQVDTELGDLKKTDVIDEDLYKKYVQALHDWGNVGYAITEEIISGNHDKAVNQIMTVCTPALDNLVSISQEMDVITDTERDNAIILMTVITIISSAVVVIFIIIAALMAKKLGNIIVMSILTPVSMIKDVAGELSAGNLHTSLEYRSEDEIGELAESLRSSIETLSSYVDDIGRAMMEFSNGNFDVRPEVEWKGDFAGILDSFMHFEKSMADTVRGIQTASEQVSGGAEQVASSSSDMAQGATDQAAVVEELTATISSVAERVAQNAEQAKEISQRVETLGTEILDGNGKMHEMVTAMQKISESSKEISQIIATINEIASQTNLLALNASIEAARAGEAGKGFAVVADQVTVLAEQSANAAKESAALIETSVKAVEMGMTIATDTARQLQDVANGSGMITKEVNGIAETLNEQTEVIQQIDEGVEHINEVVQNNSASTQECAAASQEMSSQADGLKELISRFKVAEM